jgi:hypothetical protein
MGWMSRKAAEKKCSSADPAARKRFASAFKYRLRLSFTLARGKALQFQLAQDRLPLAARRLLGHPKGWPEGWRWRSLTEAKSSHLSMPVHR